MVVTHRWLRGLQLLAGALLLVSVVPSAHAQPSPPPVAAKDPKLAKQWTKAADAASKRGDALAKQKKSSEAASQYADALMSWQKVIDNSDDAAPVLAAAGIESKLGKYHDAVRRLTKLLARKDIGSTRAGAQALLDDCSVHVGFVTLAVVPDDTIVSLQGATVGHTPLHDPLVMMPGEYTLEFVADGYQPKQVTVNVEAGTESERKIELEQIPIVVVPKAKPVEVKFAPPIVQKTSKRWLYVGVGSTAVFAGGALAFGLAARSKHAAYTDTGRSIEVRQAARVSGKRLALVSDISLGATAVALAATTYYYLAVYRKHAANTAKEESASLTSHLVVAPWIEATGSAGLTLVGGF
jgi:hypothetical protein